MKPAWLKLIEQCQADHYFGLTIPFLLGAIQQWPSQPHGPDNIGMDKMRALLTSIRDGTPDGIVIRLFMCDRRHELILAPLLYPPDHCIVVPSPTRAKPALFIQRGIVPDDRSSFDALISTLWQRYREVIHAGFFSLYDGTFRPFNDNDLKLIRDRKSVV